MTEHKVTHEHDRTPGDSNLNVITPVCTCGWRGFAVEAYRDDQYRCLNDQEKTHKRLSRSATPSA